MAYVPDPTDATQPTDAIFAETAQAEFRALKGYIASLAGLSSGMNVFRRNRIINGDFRIDQRNVGAAIIPTANQYSADRWVAGLTQASKLAFTRGSSIQTGFPNSLVVATSVQYAPLAADVFCIQTSVEGNDISDLGWGTAVAKPVTLSFYAQSNAPGTYAAVVRNGAGNRSYVIPFTLTSAAVQFFQFLVPGDTAGAWSIDVNIGITVAFDLGCGTNSNVAAPSVWTAGNFFRTAACDTLVNKGAGSNLIITGVQLEQGNTASPFDLLHITDQLLLCQRYYQKTFAQGQAPTQALGTNNGEAVCQAIAAGGNLNNIHLRFPVVMRTTPTGVFYNPAVANANARDISAAADCSAIAPLLVDSGGRLQFTGNAGTTANNLLGVHYTMAADF